ncbi:MAG: tRNA pseudouridine(54/55) synthase Pus10 [Candidatus Aenigmatarchaeota archaeon]|nr:MAG: tRNA pseudouridine(54/55) synthase Pus10 [Candidatus Aenigmarchaeota archaeon]
MIEETAIKILNSGYVCDSCLGRQFAKLLRGYSNQERGKIIRDFLAMECEAKKIKADPANFEKGKKREKCMVCENLFDNLSKISDKILKTLKPMDFETCLVGVKMSDSLVMNEEALWERTGVKYSEPIKSEIGRELGKMLAEKAGRRVDPSKPDILIIFDVQKGGTEIFSNSLFVYGEYKKFVRGLPQTKSPRYKKTIQDVIAKPFMRFTSASSNVLHALGREDKEAKCLAWRPFVLELKQPMKRRIDFKRVKKEINMRKEVKVRRLRISDKKEVSLLKSKRPYKVYRVVVDFERKVEKVGNVRKLVGVVRQGTARRVLPSKPDKIKDKKIKSIKWKRINNKRYRFEIKTESGLYLKELVSGDSGRTNPSFSKVLGNKAKVREFDLIGLEG